MSHRCWQRGAAERLKAGRLVQDSHFANPAQCQTLNRLISDGRVQPCLSHVAPFLEIGELHHRLYENRHPPGNMAVLVNAPRVGLVDFVG